MINGRGIGNVKSRCLVVLAALLLVASGRASAADQGRSAAHRLEAAAPSADIAPLVVTDPRTGAVVMIWSRDDGFSAKLAWARLTGNRWGRAHDLTFGLGVDRSPAVGTTSAGSWLFWLNDRGEVFYAPLELSAGRLLGVPTPLATSPTGLTIRTGSRFGTEGGTDGPIIWTPCEDNSDPRCATPKPPPSPTNPSGQAPPVMEGGTDAPIVPGSSGTGTILVVSSEPTCDRQIVLTGEADSLLVVEVDGGGRVQSRTMASLEPGVTAEEAGEFFLLSACTP